MKTINTMVSALIISALATSSFAAVKFGYAPNTPSNGKDYVGKIVAVEYFTDQNAGSQKIGIITSADAKLNENNAIHGGTIEFSEQDLQMGMALAANIGKDIAVSADRNYNIGLVTIITDGYWNGAK